MSVDIVRGKSFEYVDRSANALQALVRACCLNPRLRSYVPEAESTVIVGVYENNLPGKIVGKGD